MATSKKNDVPPIPVPPPGGKTTRTTKPKTAAVIPPPEATPTTPAIPATPTSPTQELPPAPNPYASPANAAAPPAYEAFPYATAPAGPPQGLSIAAMVCGLVGLLGSFFWIGFLPALAGVILGHLAMSRQPHAKGFSVTGLITGYVGRCDLGAVVPVLPHDCDHPDRFLRNGLPVLTGQGGSRRPPTLLA